MPTLAALLDRIGNPRAESLPARFADGADPESGLVRMTPLLHAITADDMYSDRFFKSYTKQNACGRLSQEGGVPPGVSTWYHTSYIHNYVQMYR